MKHFHTYLSYSATEGRHKTESDCPCHSSDDSGLAAEYFDSPYKLHNLYCYKEEVNFTNIKKRKEKERSKFLETWASESEIGALTLQWRNHWLRMDRSEMRPVTYWNAGRNPSIRHCQVRLHVVRECQQGWRRSLLLLLLLEVLILSGSSQQLMLLLLLQQLDGDSSDGGVVR